ncbi:MAG TPA: hypothetical protein VJ385_08460 [Fibrobacteria bacterium]|nr:hypothetical protein [Fibrobacteria bacterium]
MHYNIRLRIRTPLAFEGSASAKPLTALLPAAAFPLLLSGCRSDSTAPSQDPKARKPGVSLSAADPEIIRSDNGLGIKLFFRPAGEDAQGNLFVSP